MEQKNRHEKILFIQTMIILGIALIALIVFLLTGMLTAFAILVVTLLIGLLKVRSLKKSLVIHGGTGSFVVALVLTIIIGTLTSPIISYFKLQYPFIYMLKKQYLNEAYIDKLPLGATNYHFESMPSIMQGDGFYRLEFRAPSDYIEELRENCEKRAISSYKVSEPDPEMSDISFGYTDFFSEHTDATVYVFSYRGGNHPHYSYIMIDGNQVYCNES